MWHESDAAARAARPMAAARATLLAAALCRLGAAQLGEPPKVPAGQRVHMKDAVEVVVSHFSEDLSWTAKYNASGVTFRIYTKADAAPVGFEAERLPNVGRESHTYLHHIVSNYDRLAPWTVFTQAAAPGWGYRRGSANSGHLTDGLTFEDYLIPFRGGENSFFPLSAVTRLPSGRQLSRVGMLVPNCKNVSNAMCPAGGAGGWSDWWGQWHHPHTWSGPKMIAFYYKHILQDFADAEPVTVAFAQGARFAVSQERIRSRPRSYYEALLSQVSYHRDPIEGYFMEAFWYDVFHPRRPQSAVALCEYPALPAKGGAMSLARMYRGVAERMRVEAAEMADSSIALSEDQAPAAASAAEVDADARVRRMADTYSPTVLEGSMGTTNMGDAYMGDAYMGDAYATPPKCLAVSESALLAWEAANQRTVVRCSGSTASGSGS